MAIRPIPTTLNNKNNIPHIDALQRAQNALNNAGLVDELLVYRNDTNNEYAVYYNELNNGHLISLIQHLDAFMNLVETNDGFTDTIRKRFTEEAHLRGFPMFHDDIEPIATWQDIIEMLAGPDNTGIIHLDDEAIYTRKLDNNQIVSIPLSKKIRCSVTDYCGGGNGVHITIEENR